MVVVKYWKNQHEAVPERLKGTDCKSVDKIHGGSNPSCLTNTKTKVFTFQYSLEGKALDC